MQPTTSLNTKFWQYINPINTINNILSNDKSNLDKTEDNSEFVFKSNKNQEDIIENTVSLSASTIATLFEDHDYDLSQIRKGKKVKPFYISLLPKDLSLIENSQERKELFIKIVLPLILQENNNIRLDRKRLFKIINKSNNTNLEKKWLQKKYKQV